MLMLDIAVVNTALSDIAGDLHTGLHGLQWIVDAYTLARASVVESKDALARRVDLGGLLTLTGGLFLLILALLRGNDIGWGSTAIVAELAGAAALLAAFLVIETRVAEPMLPLGLFRNGRF